MGPFLTPIRITLLLYLVFLSTAKSFALDSEDCSEVSAPAPIYWIGGSGSWDDPNHWAKTSGGTPFGTIPSDDTNVFFDDNSGLFGGQVVTVPPGSHETFDLTVETAADFTLKIDGSNGNFVEMEIHGSLTLTAEMTLLFSNPAVSHNAITFIGNNYHAIITSGQDLSNVVFLDENGTYSQGDELTASERIRMYGGEWDTNGFDVHTETLIFQDGNGSSNPLDKELNANGSNIHCYEWTSRFTYGSLEVTGDYVIHAAQFKGSTGSPFTFYSFKEIHLTDLPDNPTGGSSVIEHNNFDCAYCEVEKIIIEDVSQVKLAGIFTVTNLLEVVHNTATILFNGGNSYGDEVILNGSVKTPSLNGCDQRVVFSNVHDDYTTITRNSGTLKISNAILNNLQTNGTANFQAVNSVLQGSSTGWTAISPPVAEDYLWIGPGVGLTGNWDDPSNWELLSGGSNGCIPTIVDNVYINNYSISDLRIPSPYKAQCNDFIWTNTKSRELNLDGQTIFKSELEIGGDFELHETASIITSQNHELIFSSNTNCSITTNDVPLPEIYFVGDHGYWTFQDDLVCDRFDIEGGTINTNNQDLETDYWRSLEDNPKHFIFGASTIKVNGIMMLADLPNNNVTVDPGTSLIECEQLISAVPVLYDVQMNNPNGILMDNWPQSFNKLILNGTGTVGTVSDLTVNELVFNVDNSELQVNTAWAFNVNVGIESLAAKTTPGILKSYTPGTQADVNSTLGNLCVTGYLGIEDINSTLTGVLNAPLGFDNGNNSNITFDVGVNVSNLYWIGGTGDNWHTEANWSIVSGGCPANKNPASYPNLIFDENSFFQPQNQIDISPTAVCNDVYFKNKEELTLSIGNAFRADNIYVEGGDARFVGNEMTISAGGEIEVTSALGLPGLFITDITNGFSPQIELFYCIFIVRSGSPFVTDSMISDGGTLVVESNSFFVGKNTNIITGTITNSGIFEADNFTSHGTFQNFGTYNGKSANIFGSFQNSGIVNMID